MTILVVQHKVHDFDAWKPVFDEHESVRREDVRIVVELWWRPRRD